MPTRRLPDTYNTEVIRAQRTSPSAIVNLEQFQFLQGANPEDLSPVGNAVRGKDTRKKPPVTRDSKKYRTSGR
ncbi:MAG: hypothetical protein ABR616_15820 [Dermatophilaceae bacterium]